MSDIAATFAADERVEATVRSTMRVPAIQFNHEIVDIVESSALSDGYKALRMTSGAMHDACRLSKVVSTGMIFVPSRSGISHHEDEWTAPEQLEAGANLLCKSLLKLAGRCDR
ncbi:M20/M25/M40 family metallo-hydrolase [Paraburkholderia sp. BR13439]|uniref:M20/M25/M40 family metallo-hydrolase n=1 Tax=unclassified Paraburkholderia TaxID=2615204 RepID=UPI0034CDB007